MVGWRKIKAGNELMLLVKATQKCVFRSQVLKVLSSFFLGRGLYGLHKFALGMFIAWCGLAKTIYVMSPLNCNYSLE